MPKTYRLFQLTSLPAIEDRLSIPVQSTFLDDTQIPDTLIIRQNTPMPHGFEHYLVYHEIREEAVGRVGEVRFTQYARQVLVNMFVNRKDNLLLIEGGKGAVYNLVEVLIRHDFKITRYDLRFEKLAPFLTQIRGAWFRFSDPALSIKALFGVGVNATAEFKAATELGTLSTLYIFYSYDGADFSLVLTTNAAVVLQQRFVDVQFELSVVLDAKKALLDLGLELHKPNPRKRLLPEFDAEGEIE